LQRLKKIFMKIQLRLAGYSIPSAERPADIYHHGVGKVCSITERCGLIIHWQESQPVCRFYDGWFPTIDRCEKNALSAGKAAPTIA
jgi:hypothetical protein